MFDNYDDYNAEESIMAGVNKILDQEAWERLFGIPETSESALKLPPEEPSLVAKSPCKRANYFSDLVDRLVESKRFLMAEEDRQMFIYEEDGGLYRPIMNLNSFLVNSFDEDIKRSLLAHDVREIAERLSWSKDIQCTHDSFNQNPWLATWRTGYLICVQGSF